MQPLVSRLRSRPHRLRDDGRHHEPDRRERETVDRAPRIRDARHVLADGRGDRDDQERDGYQGRLALLRFGRLAKSAAEDTNGTEAQRLDEVRKLIVDAPWLADFVWQRVGLCASDDAFGHPDFPGFDKMLRVCHLAG